jgi:hypothetical protein
LYRPEGATAATFSEPLTSDASAVFSPQRYFHFAARKG